MNRSGRAVGSLAASAQLVRFCAVGGSSVLASLAGVWVLVSLAGWTYMAATAVVAIAGNLYGFAANRTWTFRAANGHLGHQLTRYVAVVLMASLASILLVVGLVEVAMLNYLAANAVTAAVFTIANFAAHRWWTFARH